MTHCAHTGQSRLGPSACRPSLLPVDSTPSRSLRTGWRKPGAAGRPGETAWAAGPTRLHLGLPGTRSWGSLPCWALATCSLLAEWRNEESQALLAPLCWVDPCPGCGALGTLCVRQWGWTRLEASERGTCGIYFLRMTFTSGSAGLAAGPPGGTHGGPRPAGPAAVASQALDTRQPPPGPKPCPSRRLGPCPPAVCRGGWAPGRGRGLPSLPRPHPRSGHPGANS